MLHVYCKRSICYKHAIYLSEWNFFKVEFIIFTSGFIMEANEHKQELPQGLSFQKSFEHLENHW
jgi:hypothetical protein